MFEKIEGDTQITMTKITTYHLVLIFKKERSDKRTLKVSGISSVSFGRDIT